MLRTTLIVASAALGLALAGSAAASAPHAETASRAPTVGPVTIIDAGRRTPDTVPGNRLHQGATIRKGTELRRWLVEMHGSRKGIITLTCGPRGTNVGLGEPGGPVGLGIANGSPYYAQTIKARVDLAPGVNPATASGFVYILCRER
jgi:hypothetical protein